MTRVARILTLSIAMAFLIGQVSASAEERTAIVQLSITVPVSGVNAFGVLTLDYDDTDGAGTWTFEGTIDQQPANGSGAMVYRSADTGGSATPTTLSGFSVELVSVDQWDSTANPPAVPLTVTVQPAGDVAAVSLDGPGADLFGIPFTFTPAPTTPLSGNYTMSNVGAVVPDESETLPPTGAAEDAGSGSPLLFASVLGGLGVLMLVAAGYVSWRGRGDARPVPEDRSVR
jgi:hypothetical protein